MMRDFGGKGWAVVDAPTWRRAKRQFWSQTQIFHKLTATYTFTIGHKKARSLAGLSQKTGINEAGLRSTVEAYNSGIRSPLGDPARKARDVCRPVAKSPFYAFNISDDASPFSPIPGLTLGGLVVDGNSGLVTRADGTVIPGLYAAGRTAVGVCSNSYISGLSLADCIFSGRRAGRHSAS